MRHRSRLLILVALALIACDAQGHQEQKPIILAAASMQESLTDAANAWASYGHARPVLSFAASSALARQIESGANAAAFISADTGWMNEVQSKGLIQPRTRHILVRNALVLIAPLAGSARVDLTEPSLERILGDRRIAIADPASVPAGKYGMASLEALGLRRAVKDRLASTENVRAALALVERGEVPLGIVYLTDARASKKVRVVATFPESSHPPIVYWMALLKDAGPQSAAFEDFLISPAGQAIFTSFGFLPGGPDDQR